MIERDDAPDTPRGSRTEKLTTPGPIGTEEPFISVTRPAKNSVCAAATIASLTISAYGIAAIGGIDHRELLRMLAQHLGDPLAASSRARAAARGARSLKAALAAATAASTSAAPASATLPSDSPVPGLIVSASRPDFGACQAPP